MLSFLFAIGGYFLFTFVFFPEKMKNGFSKDAKAVEATKKFLLIQHDNIENSVFTEMKEDSILLDYIS